MESIVHTEGLSKEYNGVFRVKNVDLQIREGRSIRLLGAKRCREVHHNEDAAGAGQADKGNSAPFGKQMNEKNRGRFCGKRAR